MTSGMKQFVVLCKAESACHFKGEEAIYLDVNFPNTQAVQLLYNNRLRMIQGREVPHGLYVEARCFDTSLNSAIQRCGSAADAVAGILALSSNAYIEHLQLELAYDVSPGTSSREFFQALGEESWNIRAEPRYIAAPHANELITAVASSPGCDRILRAISHYREMLAHWSLEDQLLCVAYLYIAVENLVDVFLRRELKHKNMTPKELSVLYRLPKRDNKNQAQNDLRGFIRREFIFQGDKATYDKAKEVSDAYEHGYAEFLDLHHHAESIVIFSARYIREAIFSLINLRDEPRKALLDEPFPRPKGPRGLVKYLFGHLIGDGPQLGCHEREHPRLEWRSRVQAVFDESSGKVGVKLHWDMTPRLGEGIRIALDRFELWDGSAIVSRGDVSHEAQQANKVEVTVGEKPSILGSLAIDSPQTERHYSVVGWLVLNVGALRMTLAGVASALGIPSDRLRTIEAAAVVEAIELHILEQGLDDPTLASWLPQVRSVSEAHRIVTTGVLLLGWNGQAVGPPTSTVIASDSKTGSPVGITVEEAENAATLASAVTRGLQEWLGSRGKPDDADHGR